ncbi:putative disease resistance protein RGA3-like [Hibiscus syriacus]|uniref:Disease resistance protein RGA3-like n=1 Tax=Hibiscus syriacus TaxID=106335 RepID=A0A6A2ZLN0_HIBSY|nr:putative disease resistance protein RGA3-like [Hibiscus syriacus]
MRQQELQDEEERMQKRQELSSSSIAVALGEVQYNSVEARSSVAEEIVSSQELQVASMIQQPSHTRTNRDDEFDIDLEEVMVMEAIWQSIQDNSRQRNSNNGDVAAAAAAASVQYVSRDHYIPPTMNTVASSSSPSSPSGGFACAIAALGEHQRMSGAFSLDQKGIVPAFNTIHGSSRDEGEWKVDHGLEVAEAGTSYASSDVTDDVGDISTISQQDGIRGSFPNVLGHIVPESYEEQMMLAMSVSLSEDKAMTSGSGFPWQ